MSLWQILYPNQVKFWPPLGFLKGIPETGDALLEISDIQCASIRTDFLANYEFLAFFGFLKRISGTVI